MVFSSAIFLWLFLPITLLVYYLAPRRLKNFFLLLASLTFYSWGEPKYIFLMMLSIVVNYFLGLIIDKLNNQLKCCIFVVAILFNIGILMVFKYGAFVIENANLVFGSELRIPQIALPIGISFYTFQVLSYIIDLYRGEIKVQKNILNLALYITLFPQLIAGPIVRYIDIEKEIEDRAISICGIKEGIYRFIIGLSKKVLIADRVAVISDEAFALVSPPCTLAWIGIIAYAIQIYYDFSGYSDMAIGLGKMLGFNFNENFNYPYFSKSIKEFWRRWHISLSTWFRDYVYIPLGGSRCGSIRASFNLIIVFFLTGFWHGASWNFIIWGLYYAFFLILERYCGKKWGGGISLVSAFICNCSSTGRLGIFPFR